MSLLESLPHRCTTRRRVRTKDSLGGSKDSFRVLSTGVECWEQQASASEANEYQKRDIRISRKIYFVADPGLTERDQIIVTERNGVSVAAASQVPLDVKSTALPDASAGLQVLWKVFADELTGASD